MHNPLPQEGAVSDAAVADARQPGPAAAEKTAAEGPPTQLAAAGVDEDSSTSAPRVDEEWV